jgi:hypothetical protein
VKFISKKVEWLVFVESHMAPRKKFALLFQRGKVEVLPMKQDQRSQLKQRKLSFLAPAKFPFRNQPNKLLKL